MDDIRIGNTFRAIRVHKHLRQIDVARRAGVRRETLSRIERGGAGRVPLHSVVALASTLGIHVDVRLRWQGGDLDRVVNSAHAHLHESVARRLELLPGWVWQPEVSFSIYGERGVIDMLAWHAESGYLLIIELKTELVDPQELAATMGRRKRLGRDIAGQFGWLPLGVSSWVVVSDSSTNRRRRTAHAGLLGRAFPSDGRAMRRWLQTPEERIDALSFWSDVGSGPIRRTTSQVQRIRTPRRPVPGELPSVNHTPR